MRTLKDRLLEKTDFDQIGTGCCIWTAGTNGKGYGYIREGGRGSRTESPGAEVVTLREFIKAEEGLRLKPYRCTEGRLTVGYGRNLEHGITTEEADMLLSHDLAKATNAAAEVVGRDVFGSLSPARQAALISMAFQMGRDGLADFNRMLLAIRAGNWQVAHDEALDSKWARQTPERAKRTAKMILTGEW